jgi:hypothetical protein
LDVRKKNFEIHSHSFATFFWSILPQSIAEVQICSCRATFHRKVGDLKLQNVEQNQNCDCRIAVTQLRSNISFKSRRYAVAEMLPCSGIAIANILKKVALAL